jgi:hypothetical protein
MTIKRRDDTDRPGAPSESHDAAPPWPRVPPDDAPPATHAAPPPRDPHRVDGDLIDA